MGAPRKTPRISITKLGEYTVATAARRKSIVRDQRAPKDFIVARYDRARGGLTDYFVSGADNPDSLIRLRNELLATPATSDWRAKDAELSAESITRFLELAPVLDLQGLIVTPGSNGAPKLSLSGVDVSVRPDLVLRGIYRGSPVVGALKFHFSKTRELTGDASLNVASVIHQYVEAHLLQPGETASARHCLVLDVFAQSAVHAPRAHRMRLKSVQTACQEIALWWAAA